MLATGPQVTIEFDSADGLRPGKTEVRYKEVVVGRVQSVTFSDDRCTCRCGSRPLVARRGRHAVLGGRPASTSPA
jgi:hypothetical protein